MTREEAHKRYYEFSNRDKWYKFTFDDLIDEIYDDFKALQSRSCNTCEYDGTFRYMGKDSKCTRCCNFFSSRYVKKGKKDDNSKI